RDWSVTGVQTCALPILAIGEDDGFAGASDDGGGARLAARTLLREDQLAAVMVPARLRERQHHLERKCPLAVEILVQAIVVAGARSEERRVGEGGGSWGG